MGRTCPTCGHTLHPVLVDGRLVWVCPLCGVTRS
ncbi:zf-TFIIB domain-containing protein [Desulfovibrio sp. SGI.169]